MVLLVTGTVGSSAALESALAVELDRRVFCSAGMIDSTSVVVSRTAARWAMGMSWRKLLLLTGLDILLGCSRENVLLSR